MSVLKKQELMEKLKAIIGEKNDDATLSFIEDVNDTFDDKKGTENDVNWEQKYNENDAMWRKKYADRFFNTPDTKPDEIENKENNEQEVEDKPLTYENLFKEGN